MKKLRWQLLIIFLTGLVVGVLLLSEQSQPTSPLASPAPVKGGVYTEALVGSLMRLNPLLDTYNQPDRDVSRLIFSGLIRFDDRGAPQPDLAETYGPSKDGTLFNIALRKNLKWHDGKPVTADDVVFTVDLIKKGGQTIPADLQDFWKDVEVVKLNDLNLQFRLPEPFAPFADYLSFGILPKHLLDGKSVDAIVDMPFNIQPVGTGPYRFDRLVVENGEIKGVALVRAADYYGQKPYIDEIVFRYYPDSAAAYQAYKDGQVQGLGHVTADILPQVLSEPNLSIYTARRPELSMVMFNLKSQAVDFFQNADVRRALLMGINRQKIVDTVLNGQAILSDGPILPGTWAYYDGLKRVDYDPEGAKALLKKAGFVPASDADPIRKKDNVALHFQLLFPDDDQHQAAAEAIKASWTALGVGVDIEAVPYDALIKERLEKRDFDAVLVDLNLSRSPDPDPYPFWDQGQATGAGQNYTQWDHRLASEYLEQARTMVDMTERAKYYRNFQIIFNQELPALPLYYPVYTYAVDREIQGVRVGPMFDTSDRFAGVVQWFLPAGKKSEGAVSPATNKP